MPAHPAVAFERGRASRAAAGSRSSYNRAVLHHRRPPSTTCPRRVAWAFWLVCALLVQAACLSYHATAMATGVEVCSVEGTKRVPDDSSPASDATAGEHDLCCVSALATPPVLDIANASFEPPAPTSHLSAERLGAQWLAPLSRGPPAPS